MIFFQIATFGALLVNCTLGLLVFLVNPRRPANVHFLILTITIAGWLACLVLGSFATDLDIIVFWMRQAAVFPTLIPPAIDIMRLAIKGQPDFRRKAKRRLFFWLAPIIPVIALSQTQWFLKGAVITSGQFHEPVYGNGNILYMIYFLAAVGVLLFEFGKDLKTLTGAQRAELNFTLLGCAIGLFSAISLAQVLPTLTRNWQIAMFTPLSIVFLDGFVAYGIATRRIMAVTDVLRRIIAYGMLTAGLVLIYASVWKFADWVMAFTLGRGTLLPHLAAALAVAFSMAPSIGWMHSFANRLFLSSSVINVQEAVRKITDMLQSITTLDQLLEQFCHMIAAAVGAERTVILLAEGDRFDQRHPRTGESFGLTLSPEDPLIKRLQAIGEPLERDTGRRIHYDRDLSEACNRLEGLDMVLAVGLRSKGRLTGLLLLGARQSGRIYDAREQDALQFIVNQLAVAIENARLYTKLQEGKLYNEFLVDNLVSGVVAVDARQVITVFNQEASRITGLAVHEALSRTIDVLPPPLGSVISKTMKTGNGTRNFEATIQAKGPGDDIPIRAGSAIFRIPGSSVLGALLVFDDQSALKKLELQVRHSDRIASVGTLSAGMAHEIKNPLVTIKTFAQLLPERYDDPDFRKTFARLLEDEVNQIDGIVNELLTLARPAKPMLSFIHLHQVLAHALDLVQERLYQKGMTLTRKFDAANDGIKGDANLLGQMFINLFLNAIDAMDSVTGRARNLTVFTSQVRQAPQAPETGDMGMDNIVQHVKVCIADTGEGIPPENIPHLFDPFFTSKSAGTGLGLSVAHRIAKEHRISIDVESKQGRGSLFTVIIPLDAGVKTAWMPSNETPD